MHCVASQMTNVRLIADSTSHIGRMDLTVHDADSKKAVLVLGLFSVHVWCGVSWEGALRDCFKTRRDGKTEGYARIVYMWITMGIATERKYERGQMKRSHLNAEQSSHLKKLKY